MFWRYLVARSFTAPIVGTLLFVLDRLLLAQDTSPLSLVAGVTLFAGYWLLAFLLCALGALPAGAWALTKKYDRPHIFAWLPAIVFGLLTGFLFYAASSELTRGEWVSRQSFAPALKYGSMVAGILGTIVIGRFFWGEEDSQGRRRWITPSVAALLALLITIANAKVLPGLYLTIHLAMFFYAALLLVLATTRLLDIVITEIQNKLIKAASIASAVLTITSVVAAILLASKNQSALVLSSTVAAQIVPVVFPASRKIVEEELASMDVKHAKSQDDYPKNPEAVSKFLNGKRDWNILFVIVDTLRADTLPPARKPGQAHAQPGDTPYLDSFISNSYRFRATYSQASRTKRSLPPTFRSVEAHEDPEHVGVALGEQIAQLGLNPIAIIPQYFFQPHAEEAQGLLIGFEKATVYEKDKANDLMPLVKDTLEGSKNQQFFGWLHFYNMHDPYADRPLTAKDGSPAEQYRMSLKWLDGQMQRLDGVLKETGLADNTVVIFTADHGENLGGPDGRISHGKTIREREVRVPLVIHIPGHQGKEIDQTVGNLDILPTTFDLLGLPPSPNHRGHSLLPLLAGVAPKKANAYYFENGAGDEVGVAIGSHKLVHEKKGKFFHHYNVDTDPRESRDIYNPSSPVDRQLLSAMLHKNPALFNSELGNPKVKQLLIKRLREVDAKTAPSSELDLLLSLASLSKDKEATAECERIFNSAKDLNVELLVIRRLFKGDQARWGKILGKRLEKSFGQPVEKKLVEGLARQGQGDFEHALIGKRLSAIVKNQSPKEWLPYLNLIAPWKKPGQHYVAPLSEMFSVYSAAPAENQSVEVLAALLEVANSITVDKNKQPVDEMFPFIRPAMGTTDPAVAVKAIRFLAKHKDPEAAALMKNLLVDKTRDVRILNALLIGVADLEGPNAAATIMEHGKSRLLTVEAARVLGRIGNPEAIPWLTDVQQNHYNQFTREQARAAIEKINKANPQKKVGPLFCSS